MGRKVGKNIVLAYKMYVFCKTADFCFLGNTGKVTLQRKLTFLRLI